MHAALNTTALSLYLASLVAGARGRRRGGQALALAGLGCCRAAGTWEGTCASAWAWRSTAPRGSSHRSRAAPGCGTPSSDSIAAPPFFISISTFPADRVSR